MFSSKKGYHPNPHILVSIKNNELVKHQKLKSKEPKDRNKQEYFIFFERILMISNKKVKGGV